MNENIVFTDDVWNDLLVKRQSYLLQAIKEYARNVNEK